MAEAEKKRGVIQKTVELENQEADAEYEIDLLELLYRLLDKWKWIVSAAVIGALAFGIYTFFFITPKYQATAKMYVMNPSDSAINLSDLQIGSYLTKDYQEVFKAWEVHDMVIENLGLDYTYKEMQDILTISNPGDTRVLYVTVTLPDPKLATEIANEYAEVAQKYIAETMTTDKPNILSAALEPTRPVSPNKTRNVLIGFLLGAFAAAAVIVVQFVMDDKIKSADDIRKYVDLPTLAVVPMLEGTGNKKERASAQGQRR